MSAPASTNEPTKGSAGDIIKVDIQERLDMRSNRGASASAKSQVGHEMPVHRIKMDPVAPGILKCGALAREVRSIGAKDRRRNLNISWNHKFVSRLFR